jgi:nucleotide-binding universal stress UspA family protein
MLLGSVAEQVLRSVNLPVITVGPEAHLPVQCGYEERVVLLATTLRETSRPSAALACQIADGLNAKLVLLHVLPPVDEMQRKGQPTGLDPGAVHELRALAAQTGPGTSLDVEPMVHGKRSSDSPKHQREGITHRFRRHPQRLREPERPPLPGVVGAAQCPVLTLRSSASPSARTEREPSFRC